MTRYHIGIENLPGSNVDRSIGIVFKKELSKSQYDLFIQSIQVINNYTSDSQLFNIVLWNYKDFFQTINNYLSAVDKKDPTIFYEYPVNINLNRIFLNLLSSVRSYFDFMDRKLKKKYGVSDEKYILFDEDRKLEFESNFSYRFLEELRNYAQHKGFPIGSIQLGKRLTNEYPKKQEIFINLYFVRDDILNNFEWKKQLRKEIETKPKNIQVVPLIDSYFGSIKSIHEKSMNRLLKSLTESAIFIVDNCNLIQNPPDNLSLFESEDEINGERKIKQIEIPFRMCKEILHLSRQVIE